MKTQYRISWYKPAIFFHSHSPATKTWSCMGKEEKWNKKTEETALSWAHECFRFLCWSWRKQKVQREYPSFTQYSPSLWEFNAWTRRKWENRSVALESDGKKHVMSISKHFIIMLFSIYWYFLYKYQLSTAHTKYEVRNVRVCTPI